MNTDEKLEKRLNKEHGSMRISVQRPALLDLPLVAEFLGQPLSSVRRWIHRPPEGFPLPVKIGVKITYRTAEVEAWALGSAAPAWEVPVVQDSNAQDSNAQDSNAQDSNAQDSNSMPASRPRGRPPKKPREVVPAGRRD